MADSEKWAVSTPKVIEVGGPDEPVHELRVALVAGRIDVGRLHFLDLDVELVQRELERARHGERPGPHAEHMLRALGTVASGAYQ